MRFHKDGTVPPNNTWVWVFGSNNVGRHGAGAAKVAKDQFGAKYGVGEGRTGNAYAIPTKYENEDGDLVPRDLNSIDASIGRFMAYVNDHPEDNFWVTRVGCGLAGFKDKEIAPFFECWVSPIEPPDPSILELFFADGGIAADLDNISWPEEWREYLIWDDVEI